VTRLDQPAAAYYLVELDENDTLVALATIDAQDANLRSSARLTTSRPHLKVDRQKALELAQLGALAQASLVWMPCQMSRSPLYPFWEVRMGATVRYVDQQDGVWDSLVTNLKGG
jgi:hypothetical protein